MQTDTGPLLVFECVVDIPVRVPVGHRDPTDKFPSDVVHHFIERRLRCIAFFGRHIHPDVILLYTMTPEQGEGALTAGKCDSVS